VLGPMRSELAIASVTAVLKHVLENGLVQYAVTNSIGSDVVVSSIPPDRITSGADERAQLNLFLYQATPNTRLRARPLGNSERGMAARPPLALDLFYLISAYGAHDLDTDVLIGYALRLFHDTPTFSRDLIKKTLATLSSAGNGRATIPALAALAEPGLADQMEEISMSPQFVSIEEMSRLWSALQARFRPSAVYKASVVVINGGE
jgi:hypothetical protein